MPEPIIRKASTEDLDELQALCRRTISKNYRAFLGDAAVDGFINGGMSDRYVTETLGDADVILFEGLIAGLCVYDSDRIDLIMVDHDLHRNGLGTKLLAHCESKLFQKTDKLRLDTFRGNEKAIEFYKKNGWTVDRFATDPEMGLEKIFLSKKRP